MVVAPGRTPARFREALGGGANALLHPASDRTVGEEDMVDVDHLGETTTNHIRALVAGQSHLIAVTDVYLLVAGLRAMREAALDMDAGGLDLEATLTVIRAGRAVGLTPLVLVLTPDLVHTQGPRDRTHRTRAARAEAAASREGEGVTAEMTFVTAEVALVHGQRGQ